MNPEGQIPPTTPTDPPPPATPPESKPTQPARIVAPMAVRPNPRVPVNPDVVYINFFDGINEAKVKVLMAVCAEVVSKQNPKQLYFLISSNGGSVNAGITLYNFLRALPVEIVMHNIGSIDSIATVIFLAGEKRFAAAHSTFLFHGIQTNFAEKTSLNMSKYKELLSRLTLDEKKISGIVAERSKLTEAEVGALFLQGESKDLSFALEKNLIQQVSNPTIPANSTIISLNLQ
jgi:ATP-dependent Clp protease protease subunit